MSGQAHVASIDALESFRASLTLYLNKMERVLDDARTEVVSTRVWLQTDRQLHWKRELRKRQHKLAQAEQELMSAKLSGHQSVVQDRRRAVQQLHRAVDEAEQRMAGVRHWLRHYEADVESRLKAISQLRHLLNHDMRQALAFLEGATESLTEYAHLPALPPHPTPSTHPSSSTKSATPAEDSGLNPTEPHTPPSPTEGSSHE